MNASRGVARPALAVLAAGICAALHVGKLAPAIAALQLALGVTLLQAGFLLSLVQLAGMSLGLAVGAWADTMGSRRSMLLGLTTLGLASIAGALSQGVAALMVLRVVEGFGFLLVVLPAPGLLRTLVAPQQLSRMLGLWGTYMPTATAAALLCGPLLIAAWGWRAWWVGLGLLSLVMAAWLATMVRAAPRTGAPGGDWFGRVRQTLAASGPWGVALIFAVYSSQWLAVIGFLPTICAQVGLSAAATGVLTASVAAANIVGNVASGRALQRGVRAERLLVLGFVTMALSALLTFAAGPAPAALRFVAVLVFSGVGGLIPGTLFSLALRVAPQEPAGPPEGQTPESAARRYTNERCVASTVGWMQQWSAAGQFVGPPVAAWLAGQVGGWQWTWAVTGACSALGVALTLWLSRSLKHGPAAT